MTNDSDLDLVIAELPFRFRCDSEIAAVLRDRFGSGVQSHASGLLTTVYWSDTTPDPSGPVAEIQTDGRLLQVSGRDGFSAQVDFGRSVADLRLPRNIGFATESVDCKPGHRKPEVLSRHYMLSVCLENYLRVVNSVMVLGRGGIQLHSCGVIRENAGYVFFGPADAGKTTVAGFSKNFCILSDDQTVLLPDGRLMLLGVPFRSAGCPVTTQEGKAPLRRLLRLQQSGENKLEPIAATQATALLAGQCPFVNTQQALVDRLLYNCEQIVRAVSVERLYFNRSDTFWSII